MITWMRTRLGPVVIGSIVGLIAFVFVFWGVFTPSARFQGAVVGFVNGIPIPYGEFGRELERRLAFFKKLKLSKKQLKLLHITDAVFQDMVDRKLMWQEAERLSLLPPDLRVRDEIQGWEVFQQNGHFSRLRYRSILKANRLRPARFEKSIREQLVVQQWKTFFASLVAVVPTELEERNRLESEKIQFTYLWIPFSEKKQKKERAWLEKRHVKIQVLFQAKKKKKQKQLLRLLKKTFQNLRVLKTSWKARKDTTLEKVGSIKDVFLGLFEKAKALNAHRKESQSVFWLTRPNGVLLVKNLAYREPTLLTQKKRGQLRARISGEKAQFFFQAWLRKVRAHASIKKNEKVLSQAL